MEKQTTLFGELPRWTILLPKKEADTFEEDDFTVIARQECMFNDDYAILEIESIYAADLYGTDIYTAEDILELTGALACHEEFTNGVLTTAEALEEIADELYSWTGSGNVFMGDMLTDIEKANFLMKQLFDEYETAVTVDKIDIKIEKDSSAIPLADNIEKLFTEDIYSVLYEGHEISIWWAHIIEGKGLFLVVLDEEIEDEEEEIKKLPAPRYGSEDYNYYYDEVWGGYYDGYDYDDRYYRRT